VRSEQVTEPNEIWESAGEQMEDVKGRVIRSGTFGGYEMTGWRHLEDASWHVKVWLAGFPSDWIGYTVRGGAFELKVHAQPQKEAILRIIAEWEDRSRGL
jgi:hypothetical protein